MDTFKQTSKEESIWSLLEDSKNILKMIFLSKNQTRTLTMLVRENEMIDLDIDIIF
jgi:hypothetical protein